jgi:hypothetical protein
MSIRQFRNPPKSTLRIDLSVQPLCLCSECGLRIGNHRDTEDTEVAQRRTTDFRGKAVLDCQEEIEPHYGLCGFRID